jgi:L-threonylcarbamoyladenylate synthase
VPDTRLLRSATDAARLIRDGRIVAFPTETVYGLGARIDDAGAIARVFEAKGRPSANPLIVHVGTTQAARALASAWPESAQALAQLWPAPLTLVVPRAPHVSDLVTAGLATVGVRVPDHPVALELLVACGVGIAAPSANRSGRPSPTTAQAVLDDLDGRIDAVLEGDQARTGLESTVVDVSAGEAVVLRPGAVTLDQLREVWPDARLARPDDAAERSPGTRFRHYAPRAQVLVEGPSPPPSPSWWIGVGSPAQPDRYAVVRRVSDLDAYARALFAFFREADDGGAASIVCQPVRLEGIGRALMDRIERAAAG